MTKNLLAGVIFKIRGCVKCEFGSAGFCTTRSQPAVKK